MKNGFFPPLAFEKDQRRDDFIVRWYASHLKAMQEPSLWVLSDDARRHVYRFL